LDKRAYFCGLAALISGCATIPMKEKPDQNRTADYLCDVADTGLLIFQIITLP